MRWLTDFLANQGIIAASTPTPIGWSSSLAPLRHLAPHRPGRHPRHHRPWVSQQWRRCCRWASACWCCSGSCRRASRRSTSWSPSPWAWRSGPGPAGVRHRELRPRGARAEDMLRSVGASSASSRSRAPARSCRGRVGGRRARRWGPHRARPIGEPDRAAGARSGTGQRPPLRHGAAPRSTRRWPSGRRPTRAPAAARGLALRVGGPPRGQGRRGAFRGRSSPSAPPGRRAPARRHRRRGARRDDLGTTGQLKPRRCSSAGHAVVWRQVEALHRRAHRNSTSRSGCRPDGAGAQLYGVVGRPWPPSTPDLALDRVEPLATALAIGADALCGGGRRAGYRRVTAVPYPQPLALQPPRRAWRSN